MAAHDVTNRVSSARPRSLTLTLLGESGHSFRAGEAAASASLHAAAIAAAVVASGFGVEAMPELKLQPVIAPAIAFPAPPPPRGVPAPRRATANRPQPLEAARTPVEAPQREPLAAPLVPDADASPVDVAPEIGLRIGDPFGTEGGTPDGVPNSTFGVVGNAPAQPDPVRVVDLRQARLIERVSPEYPALARAAGLSAKIMLDALVGPDGRVVSVEVIQGHRIFESAARDAVLRWRYEPLLLNGVPTPFRLAVTVNFQLR